MLVDLMLVEVANLKQFVPQKNANKLILYSKTQKNNKNKHNAFTKNE